jgi:putative transposase
MHNVTKLCRALGVSKSGYYASREREPSDRAKSDAELTRKIHVIHADSRHT